MATIPLRPHQRVNLDTETVYRILRHHRLPVAHIIANTRLSPSHVYKVLEEERPCTKRTYDAIQSALHPYLTEEDHLLLDDHPQHMAAA
ncbi:hypothetical protein [Nocardiopsis sp. LOL_012]|uniref:hypothetical protein n=1 Tax=Nocardiopsis sp. LOL_012 TaxID=3345409 RepID=UPI003A872E1D